MNQRARRKVLCFLMGPALLLSFEAQAVEPFFGATPASINYSSGRINVAGVSRPASTENRPGLAAEMEARREGLERLEADLGKVCKESSLSPSWKASVRSLGSEIFSDAAIRILLAANISEVIRAYSETRAVSVKSVEGRSVVFRIPSQIPLLSTQCGALGLAIEGSQIIRVFPSREKSSGQSVQIELKWDKALSILVPASASDQAVLSQTTLAEGAAGLAGAVIRLPISGS